MFDSCLKKQQKIKELFAPLSSPEDKYHKIIELGKAQIALDSVHKIPENLVRGCQSKMYLHTYKKDSLIFFETESDALISSGLGILLTRVYGGESAEVILKCPPTYLEEIGITASLSPSRSNGLASLHLKMKQEALKLLLAF